MMLVLSAFPYPGFRTRSNTDTRLYEPIWARRVQLLFWWPIWPKGGFDHAEISAFSMIMCDLGHSYQHKHASGVIQARQQLLLSWSAAAAAGI